ncbi:uncharacterized protein DS421_17g582040 [Arachis hypogaea]|nr:uncharacterized protein DS421_17g582040 [Arachis hypogaea]
MAASLAWSGVAAAHRGGSCDSATGKGVSSSEMRSVMQGRRGRTVVALAWLVVVAACGGGSCAGAMGVGAAQGGIRAA